MLVYFFPYKGVVQQEYLTGTNSESTMLFRGNAKNTRFCSVSIRESTLKVIVATSVQFQMYIF